ncbi:MAG: amidohydrolase, partial [Sciscionella sp.]
MTSSQPSTTVFLRGRIYSPSAPDATAMAVTGGIISWIGQDAPARALHPDAALVDLGGAFVAPAFVDAHVHATAAGLQLTGLDLSVAADLGQCLAVLRDHVAAHPGELIWGHGWDETRWPERRAPSRSEVDAVAGGAAVYLSRIDVHSALVSSAMLSAAPDASRAEGFDPAGPVSRTAHHRLRRVATESLSQAQCISAQRGFLQHAAANGVACVHECAGPDVSGERDLTGLLALGGTTGMPEVVGYWGELGAVDTAVRLGARGAAGDLFVDGALGSRTAALREPYSDAPRSCGSRYLDAAQIAEHVCACTEAGIQAGFHVIGDAAMGEVIEGLHRAAGRVGRAALAARAHRLEHVEMVTEQQAATLARYGITASMQPLFDHAWGGTERAYAQRLGVERAAALNPFAMLARAGVLLAFGSDTPVTPVNPWASVRAAMSHRTARHAISARAALTAHTRAGWRAAGGRVSNTGTLVPGAEATFAVWEAGELTLQAPDPR